MDRVVLHALHALLDETPPSRHVLLLSPQQVRRPLALSLLFLLRRQLAQVLLALQQQPQRRRHQEPRVRDGDEQPG